jgi:hypothetical protein
VYDWDSDWISFFGILAKGANQDKAMKGIEVIVHKNWGLTEIMVLKIM